MKTASEKVQAARAKGRPSGIGFIKGIFTDFIELHGDRRFAEDSAIVGGIARLRNKPVTVIAMEKGGNTKEKVYRNFGSPNPEGYRKALRLMKQAEKFHRRSSALWTLQALFVVSAQKKGDKGQAIAENLMEMMGAPRASDCCTHRRGWQRRRIGAGSGRRGLDAGKRFLLCYFSGRVRQYPMERCQKK